LPMNSGSRCRISDMGFKRQAGNNALIIRQ